MVKFSQTEIYIKRTNRGKENFVSDQSFFRYHKKTGINVSVCNFLACVFEIISAVSYLILDKNFQSF